MFSFRLYGRGLQKLGKNASVIRLPHRANLATSSVIADALPPSERRQTTASVVSKPIKPRIAAHPHNQKLLDLFIEDTNKEITSLQFRKRRLPSFERFIKGLAEIKEPITSSAPIYQLYLSSGYHLIPYTLGKLHEFAESGRWPTDHQTREELKLVLNLAKLPGMGPTRMSQLRRAGCNSIEDLLKPEFQAYLSREQRVGIEFRDHLHHDTSLETANAVLEFCKQHTPSSYEWILVGEHRRGVISPDINLMVLHPDHVHVPIPPPPEALPKSHKRYGYVARFDARPYLNRIEHTWTLLQEEIIPYLELRGLIAKTRKKIFKSWHGVIRLPGLNEQEWQDADTRLQAIRDQQGNYRRLNIHVVPQKSRGAALIHFTGDVEFQKHATARAQDKGLYLNDDGLWKWIEHESGSGESTAEEKEGKFGHWEMIKAYTEEEIFQELDMHFVQPQFRNYADWKPYTPEHRRKQFNDAFSSS